MGFTDLKKYMIGFVPFPAKSANALAGADPTAGAVWMV